MGFGKGAEILLGLSCTTSGEAACSELGDCSELGNGVEPSWKMGCEGGGDPASCQPLFSHLSCVSQLDLS